MNKCSEDFQDKTLRQENKFDFFNYGKGREIINELYSLEKFLDDMVFISDGRNYACCHNMVFSLQRVLISAELTMGSIINCCEAACIADANTLLRKYRDDLFFYLYVTVYNEDKKIEGSNKEISKMEGKVSEWLDNGLKDLSIGTVLKAIKSSSVLIESVTKFELKQAFEKIGLKLNNYVHSNGYNYYNMSFNEYDDYAKIMESLVNDAKFITVSFLFLLILCVPSSIMATDFTDYLDMGICSTADSQYLVAPFVEEFLYSHISMIDEKCLAYLKDRTSMKL